MARADGEGSGLLRASSQGQEESPSADGTASAHKGPKQPQHPGINPYCSWHEGFRIFRSSGS